MIDERELTKYYQAIAQNLNSIIPVKWNKVALYGEETNFSESVSFYFYTNGNEIHHSGDIPEEYNINEGVFSKQLRVLFKAIRSLWEEFRNAGVETWKVITFHLDENRRFKVKYSYDLNMEIGDYDRQIRWAYDELGIVPQDNYSKKLLNEYLYENDISE